MERYHIGKLVQWAGTLNSRKRLQKVAYLLEAAGCALACDHYLHHYGPYSSQVASLTDEMVKDGLLEEYEKVNTVGVTYSYRLSRHAKADLIEFENSTRGTDLHKKIEKFEALSKKLLKTDLTVLELASTVAFFRCEEKLDREDAIARTVKMKTELARNKSTLDHACSLSDAILGLK
jgi:uncharacterized protein YwgA